LALPSPDNLKQVVYNTSTHHSPPPPRPTTLNDPALARQTPTAMPHRPNPIPRFNNPQYANTTLSSGQSASSTVQNAPQSATNSSRRDLNTVPPRHRGHSFSASNPPSIANQDGNTSNRGERTGGGSHRTLPPPRFQRKQRPPRVQNILAGPDNIDRSLGTLTFGPATNWGVGTQSVVSLPMAAVNAASSAMAPSASPEPKVLPSSSSTLNAPIDDLPSGFATRAFPQITSDSIPHPTNNSPPHLSFGMSGSVPYSTSLPNPPTYRVSFVATGSRPYDQLLISICASCASHHEKTRPPGGAHRLLWLHTLGLPVR